jgi:hypothetical protein
VVAEVAVAEVDNLVAVAEVDNLVEVQLLVVGFLLLDGFS